MMTGEDRREIIEYLFLLAAGLLLMVGYAEISTIFMLVAIYLNLERKK